MTLSRALFLLGRLLTVVVLVASSVYVFVYLVRWEWNRAIVAGVFLLASEAVLLTSLLLARLHALSQQVARAQEQAAAAALAARLRNHRPESAGPFAWLAPDPGRTHVFLPILIGAGVILSAISYVVEQISRVTAVPVAEQGLARGLARMALPESGLAPQGGSLAAPPRSNPMGTSTTTPRAAGRRSGGLLTWLALAGIGAFVAAGIMVLVRVLMAVPAPSDVDRAIRIDLQVTRRGLAHSEEGVARALWALCRVRVPEDVALQSVTPTGGGDRLLLTLSPAPGTSDTRELLGCLQDAVVERARADVVAVDYLSR